MTTSNRGLGCELPWRRARLGLLTVAARISPYPLAEPDERVLMPTRHGVGKLAQLDGKPVQILV